MQCEKMYAYSYYFLIQQMGCTPWQHWPELQHDPFHRSPYPSYSNWNCPSICSNFQLQTCYDQYQKSYFWSNNKYSLILVTRNLRRIFYFQLRLFSFLFFFYLFYTKLCFSFISRNYNEIFSIYNMIMAAIFCNCLLSALITVKHKFKH